MTAQYDPMTHIAVPKDQITSINDALVTAKTFALQLATMSPSIIDGEVTAVLSNIDHALERAGRYATRPTNVEAHTHCQLRVTVAAQHHHLAQAQPNGNVMVDTGVEWTDTEAIASIYCIDHERELDTINTQWGWSL